MAPLIRTITSWGLGQVYSKAKHVSRVQVKLALVEQQQAKEALDEAIAVRQRAIEEALAAAAREAEEQRAREAE